MCAAVDEEGTQGSKAVTAYGICFIDSKLGEWQLLVPVVFVQVFEGTQRVAEDAVGSFQLDAGGLVVCQAKLRYDPMPLAKTLNPSLVNLGS